MAIKGKSKSRGTKAVARGPKPAYVTVKPPLLRRRGLWVAVGTIVGLAAIAGLVYGFVNQRNQDRAADLTQRMGSAVNEFRGEIEPILSTVGGAVPPSSFNAFPDLETAIAALEGDQVGQDALDQAASAGDATASSARNAAGLFDGIEASTMVEGGNFSRDFVLYILDAKDGFTRAMKLYREAAILTSMAAEADEGPARDDLVARARGVHDLAGEIFGAAYADYVEAQIEGGVFAPTNGGLPLTGATGPTA